MPQLIMTSWTAVASVLHFDFGLSQCYYCLSDCICISDVNLSRQTEACHIYCVCQRESREAVGSRGVNVRGDGLSPGRLATVHSPFPSLSGIKQKIT